MKPKIEERIGGFDFTWTDKSIKISVTRLKQHHDNRITGWVMITTTKPKTPEGKGLLHQAEFNFASSQTMKQLVNFMTGKGGVEDWDDTIEQLRYYILDKVRQGEPVMSLTTDSTDITPPTYLVYPILPRGQPTILFGLPGVGKSYISLIIYICLLLPWYDNPLGLRVPDRPIRPLLLDYESDYNTTLWRAKRLQEGMGLPPFEVNYRRCFTRLADDIEQIKLTMDQVKAECLIIDSLAAASGGDLLKAEMALEVFSAIRQLNTTSFIIAQTQKDPELKKRTIFGSHIYEYYSRSIWEGKAAQIPGEDDIHIALHHTKSNESKRFETLGYRFFFNESKTIVNLENVKDVPEFREDMSTQDKVFLALQELGKASVETIAEAAGVTESSTKVTLSRLKKRNKVINFRDEHTWGVITHEY